MQLMLYKFTRFMSAEKIYIGNRTPVLLHPLTYFVYLGKRYDIFNNASSRTIFHLAKKVRGVFLKNLNPFILK